MKFEKEVHFENVMVGGENDTYRAYIECHIYLNGKEQNMLANKKCKGKLIIETEEPILDEAERKYLSDVIRPFRDKILSIKKCKLYNDDEYIEIFFKSGVDVNAMPFPTFEKGTMYKGMELNKEYKLEELGL